MKKITNWNEVSEALRVLSEKRIELSRAEGKQTYEINNIREKYNVITEGINTEIEALNKEIKIFCSEHKNEFLNVRTKKFSFGTISYRIVNSIKIPDVKTTIAALTELGRVDCLKKTVTTAIIKDKLKTFDPDLLAKIGVIKEKTDNISIEPVVENIIGDINNG